MLTLSQVQRLKVNINHEDLFTVERVCHEFIQIRAVEGIGRRVDEYCVHNSVSEHTLDDDIFTEGQSSILQIKTRKDASAAFKRDIPERDEPCERKLE